MFYIFIQKYRRKSWSEIAKIDIEYVIGLPLPSPLIDRQSVKLETIEAGLAGYVTMNAGTAGRSIIEKLGTPGVIDEFVKLYKQGSESVGDGITAAGLNAARSYARNLTGSDIVGMGLAGAGLALNEFLTVLLRGPTYKQHQLVWNFSPNTPDESKQLMNILTVIKNAQAVSKGGAGFTFWNYPRIFQCAIVSSTPGRTEDEMAARFLGFKPAILENAEWNYTPANVPAVYNKTDQPFGVTMALQFQEMELWFNETEDSWDAYPKAGMSQE